LARYYPGGKAAFIDAMNRKASNLGMNRTTFADSTGLTPRNVSTAGDLVKMVAAASNYPLIREFTTTDGQQITVRPASYRLQYINSNPLVRKGAWDIAVSKTGYINEAGRCLVMKAPAATRPAYMVFLQASGKSAPMGDASGGPPGIASGASGIILPSLWVPREGSAPPPLPANPGATPSRPRRALAQCLKTCLNRSLDNSYNRGEDSGDSRRDRGRFRRRRPHHGGGGRLRG